MTLTLNRHVGQVLPYRTYKVSQRLPPTALVACWQQDGLIDALLILDEKASPSEAWISQRMELEEWKSGGTQRSAPRARASSAEMAGERV